MKFKLFKIKLGKSKNFHELISWVKKIKVWNKNSNKIYTNETYNDYIFMYKLNEQE